MRKPYRCAAVLIVLLGMAVATSRAQQPQAEPVLSREFAASALHALAELREWRTHIVTTVENGYPLSEMGIAGDGSKARDAMAQAALDASTREDLAALQEIANHYTEVRNWSDGLLAANRDLRLAQLYMSPSALRNDARYRSIADCSELLAAIIGKRRAPESQACNSSAARLAVASSAPAAGISELGTR